MEHKHNDKEDKWKRLKIYSPESQDFSWGWVNQTNRGFTQNLSKEGDQRMKHKNKMVFISKDRLESLEYSDALLHAIQSIVLDDSDLSVIKAWYDASEVVKHEHLEGERDENHS